MKDAQIAARELESVLTTRRFSKEIHLPMCGVPYRRVTAYVGRLIERGLQELYGLDIANLTPVQALVVLNRLQGLTRAARHLNEQAQHDFGSIPTPTTDRDLP